MTSQGDTERARRNGVVLVPYDTEWPAAYDRAGAAILTACGDLIVAIEHIGSTAIPGIAAKPYLDIMPGLRRFADGPAIVAPMLSLGYEYRGEYGIAGRHYFTKWVEGDAHAWRHNVHTYAVGHAEWVRHLVFRDALRADAALRQEYDDLKHALAARFPEDVDQYAAAKSEFVDRVIEAHGGPDRPG